MNFNKWKNFLNEQKYNPKIGYHRTTIKNFELIKNNGLLINQDSNFLLSEKNLMKNIYKGNIPLFFSLDIDTSRRYKMENDICLVIDVSHFNLYPDVWSLIDFGAFLEEESFWFKNPPGLLKEYDEIYYNELFDDNLLIQNCILTTKTFTILNNINKNNIIEVIK